MTKGTRWLAILATVSVALNLLIAGLVVGFWLRAGPPPLAGRFGDGGAGLGFVRRAPEPLQPYLRERMARSREALDADLAAMRGARREAFEQLRAQNFDRERAAEALAKLRQSSEAQQQHLHEILLDAYAAAPPDARRMGEERMFRRFRDGGPGGRGPRPGGPEE
jgi:uncharacterized membrane protein